MDALGTTVSVPSPWRDDCLVSRWGTGPTEPSALPPQGFAGRETGAARPGTLRHFARGRVRWAWDGCERLQDRGAFSGR